MSISVTLIYFLDYQKWTYFESHILINTFCIEFPVVFTTNILISLSINPKPTQNWYFWPSDLSRPLLVTYSVLSFMFLGGVRKVKCLFIIWFCQNNILLLSKLWKFHYYELKQFRHWNVKWSASSRWSFYPYPAWGRIEIMVGLRLYSKIL